MLKHAHPSLEPAICKLSSAAFIRQLFATSAIPAPGIERQTVEPASKLGVATFLIIVVAYLMPGLVGHDPWKQDETYIFGIIHHLLDTDDWVVPTLAGEPFMEKPPLYYWVAAGFAWLFSPWLPLHDGARLATGFFMAVTCGSIGWTARHWWGHGYGRFSVLALLACLGIVFYGHLMLTDIPTLAGFAVASCGFVLARTRALAGGIVLAIGVGMGFLAKGMLAPGVLGLTALLLPACFRNWRERTYLRALAVALLAVLPWLLIWPIALYLRSPSLFMDWFWLNNIGRFVGFSVPILGSPHAKGFWTHTIPWFTFPALPLALVTLWRHHRTISTNAPIQFSIVVFAVLMAVLWLSASARPNYALPLLLPVCLLAAPATVALSARVDRFWDWSARILFGTLAAVIWSVWVLMAVWKMPVHWPLLDRYMPPDFIPPLDFDGLVVAPLLTLLAITIIWRQPKTQGRGLVSWVTGLMLCWALVSTLWLEWIDYAKSYRSVFASMQSALPRKYRCIASSGLGESERAMLSYVLGINTQRQEIKPTADCDLLLINGTAGSPPRGSNMGNWKPVWEGARPSDLRERFWVFRDTQAPQHQ
ncbi:MAG TPA: glycosyl transferase [Burkholderiaceae bacterium]|nr:glycosyl transferase [Burkholderiaceae bacterium]